MGLFSKTPQQKSEKGKHNSSNVLVWSAAEHPGWLPNPVAAWLALPPRPPLVSVREGRRLTVQLLPGDPNAQSYLMPPSRVALRTDWRDLGPARLRPALPPLRLVPVPEPGGAGHKARFDLRDCLAESAIVQEMFSSTRVPCGARAATGWDPCS